MAFSSANIKSAEDAQAVSRCITEVSQKFNVSYATVYNIIYPTDEKCVPLGGDSGNCLDRRIKDADLINRDPDKYVIENIKSTAQLEKLVEIASFLYYNFDGGGLTDNAFDALHYHLTKRLRERGRRYEKIGAEPLEKMKIKLPYPMGSLDKLYPGDNQLYKLIENGCVWSDKLDGISGLVVYRGGNVYGIYTRGDGTIGGNVDYLQEFIDLPSIEGDLAVRGEFVVKRSVWKEKYFLGSVSQESSPTYVNPRSFVSGQINRGYVSPSLVDIEFVAYEVISGKSKPSYREEFDFLATLGFKVPNHGYFEAGVTVYDIMAHYKDRRLKSLYDIDGLVLRNAESKKAFKMQLKEQRRETKIISIDWNISRYGRYVPVGVYEAVYVNGVRLHRASLHNARKVKLNHVGSGTKVVVIRAGDVIPAIVNITVDDSIEPLYPESDYPYHWSGADIVLDDIEGNKEVQQRRIVHFFETIGVPGLREKTAEKLWDAGFTDVQMIASAKITDFRKLQGFGAVKSQSLYDDIHRVMRTTRLDRFIPATTTVGVGIGRKTIKELLRYIPDIFELTEKQIKARFKTVKVPKFGAARISIVASGIPKFREFLLSLNENDIMEALAHDKKRQKLLKKDPRVNGKTFVLTGFIDTNYELEDYIYDNGGDIDMSVSKSTDAVISNNLLDDTKKMQDAHELKIPVYSKEEFSKVYGYE